MNHVFFVLTKWLFVGAGGALLVSAEQGLSETPSTLAILGVVFLLIGGGLFAQGWWRSRREAQLRAHGRLVYAQVLEIELNEALEVFGAHPFRVVASWHDISVGKTHAFKSENLWFDPTDLIGGQKIPVYVDSCEPSRYHVDVSLLVNARP